MPPNNFVWTNVDVGSYSLRALAAYDATNTAASAVVSVTVNSPPLNALGGFAVGNAVGSTGVISVLIPGQTSNTLDFTGGILTGVTH